MLNQLKEETTILHKEVEQENLARFIMDGSITQNQYDVLLRQNFMVYKGVEDFVNVRYSNLPQELKAYAGFEKTNRLAKDILQISGVALPAALQVVGARSLPTIVGKLYVIEGSMIGGMMMAKKIKECKKIAHIQEHHFYSEDTQVGVTRWKKFKEAVNTQVFSKKDVELAVTSAKDTFLLFKEAYSTVKL